MKSAFRLLLPALITFFTTTTFAQEVEPCGIYNAHVRMFGLTPDQVQSMSEGARQLEAETRHAEQYGLMRDELIIIPIVFHVIHNNGEENISDEQIHNAVEILNRDYAALNPDIDQVIEDFAGITANIEIEFRLAKKDPNGNCHPGITRTVSPLTYEGTDEVKNLIAWPRDKYLNVWVCEEANGAAGYAYLPGSVDNMWDEWLDGIVVQNSYLGAIGTSSSYTSRTLTHEVGHWLNLRHLWGGSNTPGEAVNCNYDDGVADTPESLGWTSCNLQGESCGSLDNVQNYMEYSYCSRMFTQGQKVRMRTSALSMTAERFYLSTDANLVATGVMGEDVLCQAIFNVDQEIVCVGESVQFTDASYHDVYTWTWDFGDGTVISGSDPAIYKNPSYIFETDGYFDVQLTVSSSDGSEMSTSTMINVLGSGAMESPIIQGFETSTYPHEDWFLENEMSGEGFIVTDDAAYSGLNSLMVENWINDEEQTSAYLISSTLDLSGDNIEEVRISYKWAFSFKGTQEEDETDDRLRISASGDCGADWDLRKMHRGFTDLPTANPHHYPFTPSGQSEWSENTITLDQSVYLTPNFRVMFEFESRLGNDFYLDDINIEVITTSMLEEEEASIGPNWDLYPNPAENASTLSCNTVSEHEAIITLVDPSGRLVETIYTGQLAKGDHQFEVTTTQKSRGTYFVVISLDGRGRALPWVLK